MHFFIEHFWLFLVVSAAFAALGFHPYFANVRKGTGGTQEYRPLGAAGVMGWGAALAGLIFFLANVLVAARSCVVLPDSDLPQSSLRDCPPLVQGWYVVLHDWQTGIGATIGLLGVAWSTFYNSVYGGK
jgi:hypothetical protein